jgi:hypothetical protein
MYSNISLTYDGSAITLEKMNQDGYSSEYLFRDTTKEIRMKIRHSKESLKAGQSYPIERHNCLLSATVYATPTTAEKFSEISFTLRAAPGASVDLAQLVNNAWIAWMGSGATATGRITTLTSWGS